MQVLMIPGESISIGKWCISLRLGCRNEEMQVKSNRRDPCRCLPNLCSARPQIQDDEVRGARSAEDGSH
jgi:hypothetical protein